MFFQTHKGSVTSFSILFNFQGPVAPSAFRLTAYLLYHRSDFCQALFLKFFAFPNLWVVTFSRLPPGILRPHIGSFVLLLSGDSEVILCRRAWCLSIIPHTYRLVNCFFHFSSNYFWIFSADTKTAGLPAGKPAVSIIGIFYITAVRRPLSGVQRASCSRCNPPEPQWHWVQSV